MGLPKNGLGSMVQRDSNMSDDEPLYDAVASDDDYATLMPISKKPLSQLPGQHQQVGGWQIDILSIILFDALRLMNHVFNHIISCNILILQVELYLYFMY